MIMDCKPKWEMFNWNQQSSSSSIQILLAPTPPSGKTFASTAKFETV